MKGDELGRQRNRGRCRSDGRVFKSREFRDHLMKCSINWVRNVPYSAVRLKDILYDHNTS